MEGRGDRSGGGWSAHKGNQNETKNKVERERHPDDEFIQERGWMK